MFLFILINSLRLPCRVADASQSSPRQLQSNSDSQYANMGHESVEAGFGTGFPIRLPLPQDPQGAGLQMAR